MLLPGEPQPRPCQEIPTQNKNIAYILLTLNELEKTLKSSTDCCNSLMFTEVSVAGIGLLPLLYCCFSAVGQCGCYNFQLSWNDGCFEVSLVPIKAAQRWCPPSPLKDRAGANEADAQRCLACWGLTLSPPVKGEHDTEAYMLCMRWFVYFLKDESAR